MTSLRFFAALVVLLSHSTRDLARVPLLSQAMVTGSSGVGFFFALSGFVLTWSHREGDRATRFYRRRFARVYPMHFATYLVAILLFAVLGVRQTLGALVSNPLLLQAWAVGHRSVYFGVNAPSWSLSDEAFFYLLFPFIVPLVGRLTARVTATLIAVLVAADVVGTVVIIAVFGHAAHDPLYLLPAWRLLGFLAGCLVAHLVRSGFRLRLPLWAGAGLMVVAFLAAYPLNRFGSAIVDACLLPFVLLLIAAAATNDVTEGSRLLRHRALIRLGEWSFALYLTHWLIVRAIISETTWPRTASPVVRLLINVLFVVVAVVVAAGSYYAVERPLERRLRGARPRSEMAAAVEGTGAVLASNSPLQNS